MSEEERQPWNEKASQDKDRFDRELAAFKEVTVESLVRARREWELRLGRPVAAGAQ